MSIKPILVLAPIVSIIKFLFGNNDFKKEISKVIVGQEDVVNQVLISVFSNGHCKFQAKYFFLTYANHSQLL